MEKVFGYEIGILNEKTKEGNKTIEELKKETASKELSSKIQDIINEKEKEKALEIKAINNEYKKELDSLNNEHRKEIDKIGEEYNAKSQELNKKLTSLEVELEMLKIAKEAKADE